jgi:hypothetical protein
VLRYRLHLSVLNGFTAHSGRAKTALFNTRRSWFGPVIIPDGSGKMVEPPGTAPGSAASITRRTLSP